MSLAAPDIEKSGLGLHSLEQYEPLIGAAATERIFRKADGLRMLHVVHASSTFYGGGVSEILTPLTLMMNAIGIEIKVAGAGAEGFKGEGLAVVGEGAFDT